MANTDLNQLFNQLIPMLLQASRQRKTDDLKERQFQLQQRQGAQDRAFQREKFDDANADQLRDEVQKSREFKHASYEKSSWIQKEMFLKGGYTGDGFFDPGTESIAVEREIGIEADKLDLDKRNTALYGQDLQLRVDASKRAAELEKEVAGRARPQFKNTREARLFGHLETAEERLIGEIAITKSGKRRETLEADLAIVQSQIEGYYPEGTFDTSDLFGDTPPELDIDTVATDENLRRVRSLPLIGKTQKDQFNLVRQAVGDSNLSDADVKRLISARGAAQISDIFGSLENIGTETGKFTPSFRQRQTGIQKLIQ